MLDSPDRERRLDEVLAIYLEAVEAGQVPDRAALLTQNPDLADELAAFFADEQQFDSMMAPLRSPALDVPVVVTSHHSGFRTPRLLPNLPDRNGNSQEPRLGDYELLEEIARGGMGVVFKARQKSLNRIVALKMILGGRLASAADVQRFRLEAEAAAALDHPNIVPIYEVGEWCADDVSTPVPFFSMKLIEGGNLAQHRGRFVPQPREAARLLIPIARAVDHAHQRGILHRDLKPANILLAPASGRDARPESRPEAGANVFVTDFGLAKRVGTGNVLTQTGTAVGTPSYMAPEQAGGTKHGLTTAADVYSLGAILYELLTGQPPFKSDVPLETMLQVLEKEPTPPRERNPRVDRDLGIIVLKCLEKSPARRYSSAAALADDLQRYLDGEAIQARPAGRGERLLRWLRRNPALALSATVAIIALVAVTVVSLVLYLRESENSYRLTQAGEAREQALKDAKHFAHDSDLSFHDAHKAVTNFVLRVSDEMGKTPSLLPLRKELLEQALEYYQRFLDKRGDDPNLRAELAEACFQAARISNTIGSKTDALKLYQKALPLYEQLAREHPDDPLYESDVSHTLHNIAHLHSDLGQPDLSWQAAQRSVEIVERLARAHPQDAKYLDDMASACQLLAVRAKQQDRIEEALGHYARAETLWEQLACASPRTMRYQGELALSINNAGVLLSATQRPEEARQHFLKALAIRQKLLAGSPRNANVQLALAASLRDLGVVHANLNDPKEAFAYYSEALKWREQLAAENPSQSQFQADLAASLGDLSPVYRNQKKLKEALASSQRALGILEKLAAVDPNVLYLQRNLANCHFDIGLILADNRQHADALRAYRNAAAIQGKVVKAVPHRVEDHGDLATMLHNQGVSLARLERHDEALSVLREAIDHQKLGFQKSPQLPRYRKALSGHYKMMAEVYRLMGKPADAEAATRELSTLIQNLP